MIPGVYDFPQQYGGDRMRAVPFAFNIDLTGISAEFALSLSGQQVFVATIGAGLALSGNTLTLEPFVIPNPANRTATYAYDLRLSFPDGAIRTYLTGAFPVLRNRA